MKTNLKDIENMILSEPKGELYCFTKPFLKNLRYEVIVLDFEELEKNQIPITFYKMLLII